MAVLPISLRPPQKPPSRMRISLAPKATAGQLLARAESHADKFERGGERRYIDGAINSARQALGLYRQGDSKRSVSLTWLANYLKTRYSQFGGIDDLNEAITLDHEALNLCPPGHPDRSMSLNNLAIDLSTRYNQLGVLDDLNQAIKLGHDILLLHPQGHPLRPTSLDNLGACLSARYNQLDDISDLNEAIALGREALHLCPPEHLLRPASLNNLGLHFSTRYNRLGDLRDLENAIELGREAFLLCPPEHPLRPASLNNLGLHLSTRYNLLGERSHLDEAIKLGRKALSLCPLGHPLRPSSLHSLASRLKTRYSRLREEDDKKELLSLYIRLKDVQQITSPDDFFAVKAWITAAEDFKHSTLLAYETALRLLIHHLVIHPPLPQCLANMTTSALTADAFSAGIRCDDFTHAVELLEQGRNAFWSQLIRSHPSLDGSDVVVSRPEGKTSAECASPTSESLIREVTNRLFSPNIESQGAIAQNPEIHQFPRLSCFLRPPAFSDLQQAAISGPVIIINASKYSCDALIILPDKDPIHVHFPDVTKAGIQDLSSRFRALMAHAKSANVAKDLGLFLRELWDNVVSPVVDILLPIHPPQSRIWWYPTAEFTLLPLHAAGPCRKGERNLSDLYISSYTPTLSALIHARRSVQPKPEEKPRHGHLAPPNLSSPVPTEQRESLIPTLLSRSRSRRNDPQPTEQKRRSFLSPVPLFLGKRSSLSNTPEVQTAVPADIGQANSTSEIAPVPVSREQDPVSLPKAGAQRTPFVAIGHAKATGESELKSVSSELTDIQGQVVDTIATLTRIEGPESCISRVVEELGKNQWVHLACHGISDAMQPFNSGFSLYDGRLTMERIIQCKLGDPKFTYLSACHTAMWHKENADEVVHLAGAMQFAGFRSVIGTMCAVDDSEGQTNKVTSTFYKHMVGSGEGGHLDHTRAALALELTLKELKDVVPSDQRILYVHIGA